MPFIHENFLLQNETGRRLFHEFAAEAPILDYHCHLPPGDIADDRHFADLFEIWLEGDHYKWRAMRAAGVDESRVTGRATPYEKFLAWAATVPQTLRNPLYHWTHLELKRYFDIDTLLDASTAERIWDEAQQRLASPDLSARAILRKFDVRAVCTTDDPADDLHHHRRIREDGFEVGVFPTFRPDNALKVDQPEVFNAWVDRLAVTSDHEICDFRSLTEALRRRHDAFQELGCRLSDHGLPYCYDDPCTDGEAEQIFANARRGQAASPAEHERFAANLMLLFGRLDAEKGWTKQLHLGPLRNTNLRRFSEIGADAGYDSIGDFPQAARLAGYLDRLDREGMLPKTILYNVNPQDNYVFATMIGNFQDGRVAGKLQFGSGWWYLDQKEGIEWQLNALSSTGLLALFVGMLTDSRSFMSYPRHEYFRRCLCNLLGSDIEQGLIPNDDSLVGPLIRGVCYDNAARYLGL